MVGDRLTSCCPGIAAPAFVGRGREVATLGQALTQPPAVVLVEGEPGAGKSRLVQELLAADRGLRQRTLVAVCPPYREALTLGPVVDAVRQARSEIAGLPLTGLAGALRPLLPEWVSWLPPAPEPLEDATAARHRLFRALAELVGALGVTGLVVEDVHWADAVTLEFLLFLATHQQPQPLNLVVTYRSTDVPTGSLLLRLSSRLPAGTTQVRIALPPLDRVDTADLVSSMLDGEPLSDEFARFLHERTGGVPLAVEESVRLLRDRGDLVREGGEWIQRSLADLQVSPTLRDSVLERVWRLSRPAQQLLRAAAVLAESAPARVVARVAGPDAAEPGGTGQPPGPQVLGEAVAAGLLREAEGMRVSFRHAFMGQVVYEAIPAGQRRALHLLAGQVLSEQDPPPVVPLTRHFREAGAHREWCRYAELAAQRAISSGDRTSATVLLHELLATAELPAGERTRLARQLAEAALGRREPVDRLHRSVVASLGALLAGDGDESVRAPVRALFGRLLAQQGDLAAAHHELERAIPHLHHDPVTAARAMTYLGWPWFNPWPVAVHRRWLERAAEIDQQALPPADRLMLTADRATALLQLGEPAGWRLAAEVPSVPDRPETRWVVARNCLNLANVALLWGWYDDAWARLDAGLAATGGEYNPRISAKLLMSRADLRWATGAWDGLAAELGELQAAHAEVDPLIYQNTLLLAGQLQAVAGALGKAEESFTAALHGAGGGGSPQNGVVLAAELSRIWLAHGRIDDALDVTEEPAGRILGKGLWVWLTEIAPARVAVLAAAGRIAEAAELVAGYAAGLGPTDAPAPQAGLASCRALLAQAQGEDAAPLFAAEAAAWDRLPRPYDALLARERQARALLDTGHPAAGTALLAEVRQGLWELGARGDADRVARELRGLGMDVRRPWRGGRRGYGDQPSPRELEVVRLVLAGKTNREIAQTLSKSPRTVAGQLASVMRKLGVSSRTELAVRVVEAGLSTAPEPGAPAGRRS